VETSALPAQYGMHSGRAINAVTNRWITQPLSGLHRTGAMETWVTTTSRSRRLHMDVALSRTFPFGRSERSSFRAEAFNLPNHGTSIRPWRAE